MSGRLLTERNGFCILRYIPLRMELGGIEAADKLTIASEAGSLLVAAEEVLQVKQGGTSMTLSEDIFFTGGEFRIQ